MYSRSQFYIVHRESSRQQQMVLEERTEKDYCIDGKLKDALGIKLCGEIAFPTVRPKDGQPWFPFNGPLTAKMFIQKEDTHTGYHMEAKLISVSSKSHCLVLLLIILQKVGVMLNWQCAHEYSW